LLREVVRMVWFVFRRLRKTHPEGNVETDKTTLDKTHCSCRLKMIAHFFTTLCLSLYAFSPVLFGSLELFSFFLGFSLHFVTLLHETQRREKHSEITTRENQMLLARLTSAPVQRLS
jgi:hypothetical protein